MHRIFDGRFRIRDNFAEVDLDAIVSNLALSRTRAPGAKCMVMVKADAYGHGAVPVARTLAAAGVGRFGVATVEEGLELRAGGVTGTILVLAGATWLRQPELLLDADLVPVLSSWQELDLLEITCAARNRSVNAHVKIDTGLARVGIPVHDDPADSLLAEFAERARGNVRVRVTGAMTHFANADLADEEFTSVQRDRFEAAVRFLRDEGVPIEVVHMSNSAATLEGIGLPDDPELDAWVRPGISLYGISPFEDGSDQDALQPALCWRAPIVARKRIVAGDAVSYGSTWRAEVDTEIAVLGVGYADGYFRALGNRADTLIGGVRSPVRGRVCMDLTMVAVDAAIEAHGEARCAVGELVTLLGHATDDGEEVVSASELAAHCGTIPYEVLTRIGARVPRTYQ